MPPSSPLTRPSWPLRQRVLSWMEASVLILTLYWTSNKRSGDFLEVSDRGDSRILWHASACPAQVQCLL